MNKFGQKIRDCGRPRISSAQPGAAMASVRHWAVPAVMAAALILSGCQTLNPDSAEGESNSLLKAIAVAFVGGAAIWGSTGGGSSDDSPLLPPRAEEANRLISAFGEAEDQEDGRYRIDTPLLNAPAGDDGFQIEILISSDFRLRDARPEDCERQRCVVTIPPGERSVGLILDPRAGVVVPSSPPMVSLIPSDDYDIQRVLTFREPIIQGAADNSGGRIAGQASFTVFANAPVSTGDRFVVRFRVEGGVPFVHVPGANPTTCNMLSSICEVTIPDGETSAELVIAPTAPNPNMVWRLSLVPDNLNPDQNNDNYDILPTLGFFLAEQPPSVTQTGRATFTIFSNTPAPAGGLDVRVNIEGEGFTPGESTAGRLAAIAAIVGSQANNHVACGVGFCTVRILPGATSATLILIPEGEANPDTDAEFDNRWTVALIPGTNFEIERNSNIDNPVEVENTPTGIRSGFIDQLITDTRHTQLRQVSIQTPVLDRPAGSNGFNIDFTLPANLRLVMMDQPQPVTCNNPNDPTACTVRIPPGQNSLDLLFVPVLGADVNSVQTGFVGDGEFGVPTVADEDTGIISILPPTLTAPAGTDGRRISFTIENGFEPADDSQPGGLDCQGTACTVTIPVNEITLPALLFRPVVIAPTDPPTDTVAIDLTPNQNFDILPELPPDFVVGLGTPELMVDPDTGDVTSGDVTFTVRSNENAPADEGLAVRFRIEGDAFIAIPLDADGARTDTPLVCSLQNVCTITIPAGSDTAAFILVPDGADTDLFTRWTVAIVDDTINNYGIDDDSPTANVINEEITRIAEGEEDSTLGRNTIVQFGDGLALFRPEGLPGDLDILEVPHAARITADSRRDSFARIGSDRLNQQNIAGQSTYYGYFADDGGFLPFDTSEDGRTTMFPGLALPGFDPQIVGIFVGYNQQTGQTLWRLPGIDREVPQNRDSTGYDIGISVRRMDETIAVPEFTAELEDGTPVDCPRNVCVVTIPVGGFTPPNLVLTPTFAGFDQTTFNPADWILDVAPIPSGNPLSDDILSNSRANSDEAVFYARRGDKLVARFHTTGTFTDTTRVASRTFRSVTGSTSLPPFDIDNTPIPFDPDPFAFDLPGTVNSDCTPLSGTPLTNCQAERDAYNDRQDALRSSHSDFSSTYNGLVSNICSQSPLRSAECATNSFGFGVQTLLVVDGFAYRGSVPLGEGVEINRPVAIALAITSTLVATADNAQELVYSYLRDSGGNGLDVNTETGGFFFDQIVGSVAFALYESGEITNPLPPITEGEDESDFSISQIDPSRELLGRSNVRTFLYENEFSAIGAWLIPPTAEEVNADADAPYYAAAAHWFGFETPADRIPRGGEAVYGGIAVGDFRRVTFDNAGEFAGKRSFYVFGGAQFEADFATSEMDGQFELSAYDPQEAYGNPFLLLSAEPLDTLIVNWEGQILPDGGGFANNVDPVTETVRAVDPNTGMPLTDSSNNPIMRTRDTFAPAGTIFQPERATVQDGDGDEIPQDTQNRIPVFDALVDFNRIGGVDPNLPAPIGSETLFSVFGKFFGPDADEVAGELRVFNSRTFVTVERTTPNDPESGESETVTNSLEVHFTADGAPVPDDRFDLPDIDTGSE